jgi:NitT/TauT family transport system ATP-binding protein
MSSVATTGRTVPAREGAKPLVAVSGVTKLFRRRDGGTHLALDAIDLAVADGEFVSILGPSGCGKSTLLYIVGGFVPPSGGSVTVSGRPVTGPGPDRGPVFQEFALFPWKTVLGNVAYGLREAGVSRREAEDRARALIAQVGLKGYETFYPKELSGGMKQRVAIARTLAYGPAILLMDEPFGALDAHTRLKLQNDLLALWERDRKTVLFVTHAVDEAVYLSDRVVVMTGQPGAIRLWWTSTSRAPPSDKLLLNSGYQRLVRARRNDRDPPGKRA